MKTITTVLITLAINILAQPNYTELNSGVNTSLNSVCMVGKNLSQPNYPSQVWVCGANGVVLKSTDIGSNWSSVGTNGIPATVNLITISSRGNDTVLTAGNIGSTTYVYRTVNGGLNWSQVFTQANGKINAIWMRNATSGFMTGNPVGGRWSLWKTSNAGLTWDSTGMFLSQAGSETGWNNSLTIQNNNIWFGTNNTRLYRSTNSGSIWSAVTTAPEVNSSAVWIYFDTSSNSTFVSFGGNNVYYSTNNGSSWQQAGCPDTGKFVGFCPGYFGVYDQYPMSMYTVRNNSKIYFSFGFYNYNAEYTAPSGVYNRLANDIERSYWWYSFAVRSNGGITRFSLFRGGAVRRISDVVPEDFGLYQSYPNPFNPVTNIRFSIPNYIKEAVKLVVYDILGREINVLVNEQLIAGEYEASFDASDIPGGVYFYRLISGTFTISKKMVLIK